VCWQIHSSGACQCPEPNFVFVIVCLLIFIVRLANVVAGRLSQVDNKEMPDTESGLFYLPKREK
jgi:hypothetical protein